MSKKMESIPFLGDDGETVLFYVLEQTMIGGIRYLLVEEEDDPDGTVYIMKEDSAGGEPMEVNEDTDQMAFVFVEDEDELVSVMKVFEQLVEETEFVKDF